jgi:hypothetical protein
VASNLSCIGLGLSLTDNADFNALISEVLPKADLLGTSRSVHTLRWQDPSGARLILAVRGTRIVNFYPSFAGEPGIKLAHVQAVNDEVVVADVIDEAGDQTTSVAFELEQRRALRASDSWSGEASLVAFAPDAEFFTNVDDFDSSPRSLLNPDADSEEPPTPFIRDRALSWPMRMGSESFMSYGVFGEPASAEAYGRVNAIVVAAETRRNLLTGQTFLACRARCLGFELDILTEPVAGPQPTPGSIVAANVWLVASIEALEFAKKSHKSPVRLPSFRK